MASKAKKTRKPKKTRKSSKSPGPGKNRKLKKRLKQVLDPKLAKALANSLRGHVLLTLSERTASPKEMAAEIGIDVKELNYHIRVLVGLELISLAHTEKRRGFHEHFYALNAPVVYLDDSEWRRLPEPVRVSFSASLLQTVMNDAVEALRAGTFNARDSHATRATMLLSDRGCSQVMELMGDTLEKMLEIGKASAEDLERTGEAGIPIEVFMVGFETAAHAGGDGSAA